MGLQLRSPCRTAAAQGLPGGSLASSRAIAGFLLQLWALHASGLLLKPAFMAEAGAKWHSPHPPAMVWR